MTLEDAVLGSKPKIFVSPVTKEMDLDKPLLAGKGVLPTHISEKITGPTNQVFSKNGLQTQVFLCLETRSNLINMDGKWLSIFHKK